MIKKKTNELEVWKNQAKSEMKKLEDEIVYQKGIICGIEIGIDLIKRFIEKRPELGFKGFKE